MQTGKIYKGDTLISGGGSNGKDGASAYELWLAAGNTGTVADFLESLKGEPGSSIDYPFTLADDLVTTDTTKALAAPQGVVLKGMYDGLTAKKARNYINGHYIKNNGAQEADSTKFRTYMIPASQGDVVYWRYGSTASMYLCEYNASGVFLNAWVANSNTGRSITLTRETTAFIVASFNSSYFDSAALSINGTLVFRPTDGEYGSIAELQGCRDAVFSGETFRSPIKFTINRTGVYMNTSGEDVTSTNYGVSDPIFLPKGIAIEAELACGTSGAAIAVTDATGTFIKLGHVGVTSIDALSVYKYTATEDCYVTLCAGFVTTHGSACYLYDASSLASTDGDVIYSGVLSGGDNTLLYHRFPARQGDYLHISFPEGNWATSQNRGSYNKLILGSVRIDGVGYGGGTEVLREGWVCPDYGFDFIVDTFNMTGPVSEPFGGLAYRAKSGISVPFTISRLSKTTPKKCFDLESAKTIRAVKNGISDGRCLVFAICSDLHYRDLEEGYRPFAQFSPIQMAITMRDFTEKVRTDNVVCLGDVSDGRWGAEQAKKDAYTCQWFLAQCKAPVLNVVGNHDDNRYYAQQDGDRRLTQAEIYSNMMAYNDERATVDGTMGGCNYYRDIERAKVRLITLMGINFSGQYAFTKETQTWLTATFASMPEGWKAIIFTHVPPVAEQNWSGSGYTGGEYISDIISANLDKFLFLYEGHTHIDNVYVSPWTAINIGCQKVYNSESGTNEPGSSAPEGAWWPIRAVGDYREVLWDAVVVDQTNSLLSCIRFGAGVDRYIHLEPITLAAGGSISLTPSVITATSWETRTSEVESISIENGVASLTSAAVSGSRHIAIAKDTDGNIEIWCIKVS